MIFECPGSKFFKQPVPEAIKCPGCGREAEIWSDERQAVCPDCGKCVRRKIGQSCLDWCAFAKDCTLGKEI
jgi:DNA-directed RNA polymerase subunit RPC12/RpoP